MTKFNILIPVLHKHFLEKLLLKAYITYFLLLCLPLAEIYRIFTLEITPQQLIHTNAMLYATNPCHGYLGKGWCFQRPNFQGGLLQNRAANLKLTFSSGFILWPCTTDPMNKTLSFQCSLNNWTFSGSVDLYNEISTPICVHNAPMPARNGCNIDAFQCRSHHSQSRVQ